ncbi:hypothetical protein ACFQ69_03245 [Streptomyces sp. NPDC056470]|uniref:hypothetical protein n=1 Tax=Streptomyces sp. NPDC056470 TaxID=3345831 RepID=UPI0036D0F15E
MLRPYAPAAVARWTWRPATVRAPRVLRAEFDECPLGDLSLWGRRSALFLGEAEQKRLWQQGVDPWEGKR